MSYSGRQRGGNRPPQQGRHGVGGGGAPQYSQYNPMVGPPQPQRNRRGGCLAKLVGALIAVLLLVSIWFLLIIFVPPVRNFSAQLLVPVSGSLPKVVSNALYATTDVTVPNTASVGQSEEDGLVYQSLNDEQKALYNQIFSGLTMREDSFTIAKGSVDGIDEIFRAVRADHPELFWLDGSAHYSYYENGGAITITPGLCMPLDQIDETNRQIEEVVQSFLSSIPADADDYTKALAAYEYIIDTTDYDLNASQNQNMQSVLLGHASVCAGYARAFQYLMQRAGVTCGFVEGAIASSGEEHAWNIVRMDGDYTYVDLTWGDPTYSNADDLGAGISYDYLGLTTDEIVRDGHIFDNEAIWPACESTSCSYYAHEGLVFDSCDSEALSAALHQQHAESVNPVAFKFSNEAAYIEARSLLETGEFLTDDIRTILENEGTLDAGYQYQCSDELYILKLYL